MYSIRKVLSLSLSPHFLFVEETLAQTQLFDGPFFLIFFLKWLLPLGSDMFVLVQFVDILHHNHVMRVLSLLTH